LFTEGKKGHEEGKPDEKDGGKIETADSSLCEKLLKQFKVAWGTENTHMNVGVNERP
jgi:hypothetical protein